MLKHFTMIQNYDQLLICIKKVDQKILLLKTEKNIHIYNLNFTKAKEVLSQQQLLELQVLNYIGFYEEKIRNKHLENKLYSLELCSLKKSYQTKTIADDLIHCLKQLIINYDELKNDLWIFSALNLNHALAIKGKINKTIFTIEEIYFELANIILLSNAKNYEKQKINYNLIIVFFNDYYTSQIEELQEKLRSGKSASKFIQSIKKLVNPVTLKMTKFKLENKKETEETTTQLRSLIAKKERYEKLSKTLHNAIFN